MSRQLKLVVGIGIKYKDGWQTEATSMKLFELFHHPPSAFLGKKLVHVFGFDVGVTIELLFILFD